MSDLNDRAHHRRALWLSLGPHVVIAEGVETTAQHDFLIDHGCHAYQDACSTCRYRSTSSMRLCGNRGIVPVNSGGSAQ